jgi:hypothetical protein
VYGNTVSGACASLHPGHVCAMLQFHLVGSLCVWTRHGLAKMHSAAVDMLEERKYMLLVSAYEFLVSEETCR